MYNFIFLFYGLLSLLTQLVIFRELAVLFYGNELFLGTFLSSWLFWVGLGSLSVRWLFKKESRHTEYFSYAFLALSLVFPWTIFLARISKSLFAFGEFLGPFEMVLFTFGAMGFLCFLVGCQFTLACGIASNKITQQNAIGRVYTYEALGAVIAGVLFTYLLIGNVATFTIALMLSLVCIFVGYGLLTNKKSLGKVLLAAAALVLLFISFRLEPLINHLQWSRYEFIQQKEARNATLSLVKMASTKNVFADGIISASFPNPQDYEPVAHWPLLIDAAPRQVLIIGDSSLGVLKEALKYKLQSLDYIVLDSSFVDLVKPFLDAEDISALGDRRLNIYYGDARLIVKKKAGKYDVVIMNIPEVPNLKVNRFYTAEFFRRIKSVLKPRGILALSVVSSENYLSLETRIFNASVYKTLESVFGVTEVIPGDSIMFLSSSLPINMQKETILSRYAERGISNLYFIPSYIEYKLDAGRRSELKKLLQETTAAAVNRDFKPVTCYYFYNFWLNKFVSPLIVTSECILLLIGILIVFKKRKSLIFLERKEFILIFMLGFTGILLELILLVGYQIISGYIYWQIGALFASFMAGIFLGSLLGNRFKNDSHKKYFLYLVILSLIISGLSICMVYLLPGFIYLSAVENLLIFILLLALVGAIVGAAFVIAGFLINREEIMGKAGSLYTADLWGAALGAMLSTNFIVPVFGIPGALIFCSATGLLGLFLFFILCRKNSLCSQI